MSDKLKFTLAEPRRVVLPIPMSYDRWMQLAAAQNALRATKYKRQLTQYELDEIRRDIYG